MCETLELYNSVCQPPQEALKPIQAGRLKGKTDINPMWRIKKLTEIFGPCGTGWNIQNVRYQYIPSEGTGEMICLCELELVVFTGGAWSAPIYGIGGNMLVAKEKNGLYADDDAPKKAYSDAIGTACKALGFAGNIYWENDPTKYSSKGNNENDKNDDLKCQDCGEKIDGIRFKSGNSMTPEEIANSTQEAYGRKLCWACAQKAKKANAHKYERDDAYMHEDAGDRI